MDAEEDVYKRRAREHEPGQDPEVSALVTRQDECGRWWPEWLSVRLSHFVDVNAPPDEETLAETLRWMPRVLAMYAAVKGMPHPMRVEVEARMPAERPRDPKQVVEAIRDACRGAGVDVSIPGDLDEEELVSTQMPSEAEAARLLEELGEMVRRANAKNARERDPFRKLRKELDSLPTLEG